MNDSLNHFSYDAAKKTCPSCGESYLLAGGYLFCEREHGTRKPMLERSRLPVATRTTMGGRFTITDEEGSWRLAAHGGKELLHYGPPEGSVVASIKRYDCDTPVAAVFVRGMTARASKPPRHAGRKCIAPVIREPGFLNRIAKHRSRIIEVARLETLATNLLSRDVTPYGAFIRAIIKRQRNGVVTTAITRPQYGLCLMDGCRRDAFKRGLCKHCYTAAGNLQRRYGLTWLDIDLLGLASPAITKTGRYFGIFQRALEIGRRFGAHAITVADPDGVCLVDGCDQKIKTRGLCQSCAGLARRMVRDGKTTWKELESLGIGRKCRPGCARPSTGRSQPACQ